MKRPQIFVILAICLLLIFVSCAAPPPAPAAAPEPTVMVTPTATPKPTPTPTPPPTPINVAIDYFGIKSTHQPAIYWAPNTIQLIAIIEDGNTTKQFAYPSSIPGVVLKDFSLQNLEEQIIFQIPSVGGYLKISVLAYSCEDKDTALAILKALQSYNPNLSTFIQFYENLPQSKILIGYYEHTWYPTENWGISQNEYKEANGDLTFWFRIWSNSRPTVIPPPLFVPDVKIQSVTLPSGAKTSSGPFIFTDYSTTLRLVNNESVDVTVSWQANSSVTGNFDSGSVTVPKNSYKDVTKAYHYTSAGPVTINYTIYYNGVQIDTKSGAMNVAP
jgi:PBP1b-binding outer membrane lipoprotein LpoB